MTFLATQMALFIAAAGLMGLAAGWLIRHGIASRQDSGDGSVSQRLWALEQERDGLEARVKQLTQELERAGDSSDERVGQLKEEVEALRQAEDRLRSQLEEFEEERERELTELKKRHEEALEKQSAKLQATLADTAGMEEVFQRRYETLLQEVEDKRAEVLELSEKADALRDRCTESEQKAVDQEDQLRQARERTTRLEEELADATQAAAKAAETVQALEAAKSAAVAAKAVERTAADDIALDVEDLGDLEDTDGSGPPTWVIDAESAAEEESEAEVLVATQTMDSREEIELAIQADVGRPIADVVGQHADAAEQLRALGVETSKDLLRKCGTEVGIKAVASSTGIESEELRTWVGHADLMRISGLDPEHLRALHDTGVTSVRKLSTQKAGELANRMKTRRASDLEHPATEATVKGWIDQAKALPKITRH